MMISNNIMKTILAGGISLCLFLTVVVELFALGNSMNVPSQQPQILPSFNTVGFQISFSGDDNKNGSASIRYRKPGGNWREGHPCVRCWYDDKYEWAGRIFHLQHGTQYEIEVKFNDPDGVSRQNPLVFTLTSRSEPIIENSGGTTYHVSPSGNDSNNGSSNSPFRTIDKAISMVSAGGTVLVHQGTYRYKGNSSLVINKSGTAQAPIIIKAADGEEVFIDGGDRDLGTPGAVTWRDESPSHAGIFSASCNSKPYVVFYKGHYLCESTSLNHLVDGKHSYDGKLWEMGSYGGWYYSQDRLYIKFPVTLRNWNGPAENPSSHGVQAAQAERGIRINGDYVVLDGFFVQHTRLGIDIEGNHVVVRNTNCRRNRRGIDTEGYFTLIDHCEVGCSPTYWYREWELGHDVVTTRGIKFKSYNGGNCVLRNSRVYGVENGLYCGGPPSSSELGDPAHNPGTICINNEFDVIGDDAIEADGACYNVVIYGNYFHDNFVAISVAPLGVGPIWAIRNVIYSADRLLPDGSGDDLGKYGGAPYGAFKFNCGYRPPKNGRMLIYNNTSLVNANVTSASPFSRVWDNTPGLDVVLRNNSISVMKGRGRPFYIEDIASSYTYNLNVDYDNIWSPSGNYLAKLQGKYYSTLNDLRSDGYEMHGISENVQFANPAKGDFSLSAASSLIDAGIRIPGINDAFHGNAPDIGAVEYGQVAAVSFQLFGASVKNGAVELEWRTSSTAEVNGYMVERSMDGKTFLMIGYVRAQDKTDSPNYKYLDNSVDEGKYHYRIKQINLDGTFEYSTELEVIVSLPNKFNLNQNYPNPFNPSTEISYFLPHAAIVELSIYDITGRHIKTLVKENQSVGRKKVNWNGRDNNNIDVASGLYFYQLKAGEISLVRRMLLLR